MTVNSSFGDSGVLKNNSAFNSSGFKALPGGFVFMGAFSVTGKKGKERYYGNFV